MQFNELQKQTNTNIQETNGDRLRRYNRYLKARKRKWQEQQLNLKKKFRWRKLSGNLRTSSVALSNRQNTSMWF